MNVRHAVICLGPFVGWGVATKQSLCMACETVHGQPADETVHRGASNGRIGIKGEDKTVYRAFYHASSCNNRTLKTLAKPP